MPPVVPGLPESGRPLSVEAQALVTRALAGLPPGVPLVDAHIHMVALRQGCEVNPSFLKGVDPAKRLAGHFYMEAGGTRDLERFDEVYLETLLRRAGAFGRPVRLHLLAMDRTYTKSGCVDRPHTDFYVPNAYVVDLARAHPGTLVPVISVHPVRPDALDELERWAAQGVRWVKWLPNAQNIDPADPRWDAFYSCMARHRMILLVHTGDEHAVTAPWQAYGNPLRLRRPLDHGVRVVAAHCAGDGRGEDFDHPGRRVRNFELFLRLMEEPCYRGLLYGDISALVLVQHLKRTLLPLLRRPELHERLLNGTDYPLPAVGPLIWPSQAQLLGLVSPSERRGLQELKGREPLLLDFVLKRTLRDPLTGNRFQDALFTRDLD
nr:amidohydrolase family protein [uncultured Holophaga sp.]